MTSGDFLLGLLAGLAVNETSDVCPALAHRLVRWAAYRSQPDAERAEAAHKALAARINDQPGKLLKLAAAVVLLFRIVATVGLRAGARPPRPTRARPRRPGVFLLEVGVGAAVVVGIWLWLDAQGVGLPEAYTVPAAAVAFLVGLVELRRRPWLGSWAAFGPALALLFVPTMALILVTDSTAPRRLILIGLAALATIIGVIRRLRAPVVIGGTTTTAAIMHELSLIGIGSAALLLTGLVMLGIATVLLVGRLHEQRRNAQRLRRSPHRRE